VRRFGWIGSALLIALTLALLGFWYISARRTRLDEANRRELARVAHNLETILGSLSSSAATYFSKEIPSVSEEISPVSKKVPTSESGVDLAQSPREFSQRNPYVVLSFAPGNLVGTCPALPDPTRLELRYPNPNSKETPAAAVLKIDTDKIFDDVAIADTFEYLFISSDKGMVIVDMGHGTTNHRDGLGWLDRQARASADRLHPSVGVANLAGLIDESTGNPIKADGLAQASGTRTVLLGANRYQLFSYPFAIKPTPCDTAGGTTRWVVGGLVDPLRMWREAATLAPRSTLLLLLLLLIPFFAEPAIKLLLLRPTERLRYADVCLILPNTAVLLMLATVLLLDVGSSDRLAGRMQSDLAGLADVVDDTMTAEFTQMRDQVVKTDRLYFNWPKGTLDCTFRGSDVSELLTKSKSTLDYKSLWLMFWVDPDGRQVFKMDVHRKRTPKTNIRSRAYFQAVHDRPQYLWAFGTDGADVQRFHVESVRSVTTGELTTVVAIPSKASDVCEPAAGYVAAISGPPVSIEHPLLPGGSEFAVIASDGQVLYHSDRRRTLKENFFEEVSDPHAIHAAIVAGSELNLSTSYGRRPVDLFLRPFRGIPLANWFVVTMRDSEWRETVSTEAMVASTFLGVLAWLPLLAVTVWAFWHRARVVSLIWPDASRDDEYRAVTFTCGALAVIALGAMWLFRPTALPPLLLSMTLPIIAVMAAATARWRGHRTSKDPGALRWYLPAMVAFIVAAAVIPAAGVYRHSWHRELGKFDRFERNRMDLEVRDWRAEDRDRYRQIPGADEALMSSRAGSRAEFVVQYAGEFTSNPLDRFLDRHLPFYNETLESVRYQTSLAAAAEGAASARFSSVANQGIGFSNLSLLLWAATAIGVLWWLRLAIRGIFWTSLSPAASPPNRLVVLVAPSPQDKVWLREFFGLPASRGNASPSDEAAAAPSTDKGAAASSGDKASAAAVVIDFEEAVSQSDARTTLERLEQSLAPAGAGAVLIAESDPLARLNPPATQPPAPAPVPDRERWIAVLGRGVAGVAVPGAGGSGGDAACEAYFNTLWHHCTRDEQLTLIHLADEEFVNPHNAASVKRLLSRGLVAAAPLRIASPDFRHFVQSQAEELPEVKQWEQPEGGFGWHQARWVLFLLLVGGLVLAWATGENWIKGATAFLTTLAGGVEAFQRVATATQRLGPAK
jgi:hypothetical protein